MTESTNDIIYSSSQHHHQPYRSSYVWSLCTFQNFCYCVQLVNCILVGSLIAFGSPRISQN
jgi:hypothetical protein